MGVTSNGHIGMSQDDARQVVKGEDGKALPDGPRGSRVDEQGVQQLNADTTKQLGEHLEDALDFGGVRGKLRRSQRS
jgi:hypothetical protein